MFMMQRYMDMPTKFGGVMALAMIALYVLRSWGVYKMCRNTGLDLEWFVWVPFLHTVQCARIGDRTRLSQNKPAILLRGVVLAYAAYLAMQVLDFFLGWIFLIGLICKILVFVTGVAIWVAQILSDYWAYMDFEPSRSGIFTLFSVFKLDGIAKFMIANNTPVGVAGVCYPRQPKYGLT